MVFFFQCNLSHKTYEISSMNPTTVRRTSCTGSRLNASTFSMNSSSSSASEFTTSSWIFFKSSHLSAAVFTPDVQSFSQLIIYKNKNTIQSFFLTHMQCNVALQGTHTFERPLAILSSVNSDEVSCDTGLLKNRFAMAFGSFYSVL